MSELFVCSPLLISGLTEHKVKPRLIRSSHRDFAFTTQEAPAFLFLLTLLYCQCQCLNFLLKPRPFCKLSPGLGNTIKSSPFPQTLALFSLDSLLCHLSFFLVLSRIWQKLFILLSSTNLRLQWAPGHSFLPSNNMADKLAQKGALLQPLHFLAFFFFLSLAFTFLFSRTEVVQLSLNFLIHVSFRSPQKKN